jgi:hypothetical protein
LQKHIKYSYIRRSLEERPPLTKKQAMKKYLIIFLLILLIQGVIFSNIIKTEASDFWGISDIEFENEKKDSTLTTVFLTHEFLEKEVLKITINVKNAVTPIIGAAFHLGFDLKKLDFLKYVPGDFLEKGGDPMYLITQKSNKIIFGETLTSKDNLPVGEGEMAELYFQIKEEKPYNFSFENAVLSTLDTVMQDIEEVDWIDYEISDTIQKTEIFDTTTQENILDKTMNFFSLKNVLLTLIPASALFFTLWTIYINKIKPKLIQNA